MWLAWGSSCHTLDALEGLKEEGKYTILQTPEEVLAFNCTPNVNPPTLLVPLPLPDGLPPSPVTGPPRRMRYGLPQLKPHLAKAVVLTQQLAELKSWATTPIKLSRKGPALKQVSWINLLSCIWLFLGFCFKWMGVQQPCLQHFLQPKLLAAFMSFHIAMKHGSLTMKHHISTYLKVLAWWSTKPGGHDKGLQVLRKEWLPNLSHQVSLDCTEMAGRHNRCKYPTSLDPPSLVTCRLACLCPSLTRQQLISLQPKISCQQFSSRSRLWLQP